MPSQTSLFSTLMQHLPMGQFDRSVKRHKANKGVRTLTARSHLGAMVIAQLSDAKGLRDVEAASAAQAGELKRLARRAYRQYRHRFDQTTWVVRWALKLGRVLRDLYFKMYDGFRSRTVYDPARNYHLGKGEIAFVGLWDTVDAYGLPIDELTEGVNRWIWPLSLPNYTLSPKVGKAWVNRAGANLWRGRHAEARADCDRALELNPREALAWLNDGSADLIITDYKMPNMDGATFIAALRKLPELRFAREAFLGRAIHNETWRAQVDAAAARA